MASVLYLDRAEGLDVSGYGEGVCIDCGTVSARLLHPGIPHICSLCLFRPSKPEDPTADLVDPASWTPADTLAARLDRFTTNGVWRGNIDARGKNLPESYNRGKRE